MNNKGELTVQFMCELATGVLSDSGYLDRDALTKLMVGVRSIGCP